MSKSIQTNNKLPKIALLQVSGELDQYWGHYPPLGLASVASYLLEKQKFPKKNIIILDNNLPYCKHIIEAFEPDIIGFSCFTKNYPATLKIAQELRRINPNALFVLGGVHISLFPDSLKPVFDLGVLKEGEVTFSQIVKKWPAYKKTEDTDVFKKTSGLILFERDKTKIVKTKQRKVISNIDDIPLIDWTLFPSLFIRREIVKNHETQKWELQRVFPFFTARGCPYNCIFCARSILWPGIRFFSPERVAKGLEKLHKTHNITALQIWDDVFTINRNRLKEIENELRKKELLDEMVFYRVFARSDLFTQKMARQLKKLNVLSVTFGFESGSNRIIKFLKRDTTSKQDNLKAVETCEKEKIGYVACLMMGAPNEKKADIKKTYDFVNEILQTETLEVIELARTTPFPGTDLYRQAEEEDLLPKNYLENYLENSSIIAKKNNIPILIKDPEIQKVYKKYWNKIKEHEHCLNDKNQQTLSYQRASLKKSVLDYFEKELFIPKYLLMRLKQGNYALVINLIKNGITHKVANLIKKILGKLKRFVLVLNKLLNLCFGRE